MRRRPWALVVLAVLHFIAPIGNIFFNALITERNVIGYFIYAMSPQYLAKNWIIIVAPIFAGYAIYACKRWSFYGYIIAITTLFIFSYAGYESKSEDISIIPVILVYLVNIGVVTYFLIPAVRNIYFDRRMRWWEIQPRYKCNYKCEWTESGQSESFVGRVGNISENGLFLKCDDLPTDHSEVKVRIFIDGGQEQVFDGEAILHNKVDALGFGVKFSHTPETRKVSNEIIAELDSKGMRISTLDLRPEDSFSFWVRTLLTTGRGLLPKKEK